MDVDLCTYHFRSLKSGALETPCNWKGDLFIDTTSVTGSLKKGLAALQDYTSPFYSRSNVNCGILRKRSLSLFVFLHRVTSTPAISTSTLTAVFLAIQINAIIIIVIIIMIIIINSLKKVFHVPGEDDVLVSYEYATTRRHAFAMHW